MRKLLISMLMLSSFIFVGSSSVSTSGVAMAKPQVRIQIGPRRRYRDRYWNRDYARGDRIGYGRTFTRDVQRGWRLYRETYRVVYLPNGVTQTQLVSRIRLN
jgi:hypothetical protein